MGTISSRVLAHELDAAWIIALWKAIHGGDPAPNEKGGRTVLTEEEAVAIGTYATTALVGYIAAVAAGGAEVVTADAHKQISSGAKAVGFELLSKDIDGPSHEPPPWCFHFKGMTICVPRPKVARVPGR